MFKPSFAVVVLDSSGNVKDSVATYDDLNAARAKADELRKSGKKNVGIQQVLPL